MNPWAINKRCSMQCWYSLISFSSPIVSFHSLKWMYWILLLYSNSNNRLVGVRDEREGILWKFISFPEYQEISDLETNLIRSDLDNGCWAATRPLTTLDDDAMTGKLSFGCFYWNDFMLFIVQLLMNLAKSRLWHPSTSSIIKMLSRNWCISTIEKVPSSLSDVIASTIVSSIVSVLLSSTKTIPTRF